MKNLSTYKSILFSLFILVMLSSCSNDSEGLNDSQSVVSVKLKSASEDTNRLMLDIESVKLMIGDNEFDANSWLPLATINRGVQNLSQYNEGAELVLVENALVPAGKIKKIKLILGDNNVIVIDNVTKKLVAQDGEIAPSNIVSTTLAANKSYEFILEFEADNSVVIANDDINFRPEMNTLMRHLNN
ncbi:DUF4382 domain-containing protein [Sediminibacter sp. Hel_I_10]|uniref:DUF4382 domain-containing protein n=1 Tax=Sediminibacter sp. Hel_I_10 TaxID=1392490 RepID=UPI0012DDEB01|nr:DUF4382 domain-containing protein [Sediminibacter sp. Hel_I_10]